MSIYAGDVALFVSPVPEELAFVRSLLNIFGEASGLKTNLAKSSILPTRCEPEVVQQAQNGMECGVAAFPCKYLGLPLSLRRLTKNDLQPIIDRIADMLPGWKAVLMAKSGRLILTKAVIKAIPIHLLIALDVPWWFIKCIDKIRRGFLWKGRTDIQGGHCPIAWQRVTRPLHYGVLEYITWR